MLATILAYWDSGFQHSINVEWRRAIDDFKHALGKKAPVSLADMVNIMDGLLKYLGRYRACTAEHAAGAWRLLAMMYRAGVDEKSLLDNLTESLRNEIESSAYNYESALRNFNIRDAIAITA